MHKLEEVPISFECYITRRDVDLWDARYQHGEGTFYGLGDTAYEAIQNCYHAFHNWKRQELIAHVHEEE